MVILYKKNWPFPEGVDSWESLGEYLELLYIALTEDSGQSIVEDSTQMQNETTNNIGGAGIGNIGATKIDDESITTTKIAAGAIITDKIDAQQITVAKLASDSIVKVAGGVFSRAFTVSAGTQSITGVGFQPTYGYFFAFSDENDVRCWGVDNGLGTITEVFFEETGGGLGDDHSSSIRYHDDAGSTFY